MVPAGAGGAAVEPEAFVPADEGGRPWDEGGRPCDEGGRPWAEGGRPVDEGGRAGFTIDLLLFGGTLIDRGRAAAGGPE